MVKTSRKLWALLALAGMVALPAAAQSSVTLYGVVDAGISFDNSGGSIGRVIRLGSGYVSGSRIGFTGTEDIGGGVRALFNLEMGLDVDTGALKTYSGDPSSATASAPGGAPIAGGFNRRSHVGLSGAWGTLLLGRDYTPLFWTGVALDPMAFGLYGNLQAIGLLSGTGIDRFGRASNALFYTSPTLGGFKGRLMYSLGSESDGAPGHAPKGANTMVAAGADYRMGPVLLSGAYQRLKLPLVVNAVFNGTGERKDAILGASYTADTFSVSSGYLKITQPTPNADGRALWLGGSYTQGPHKLYLLVQKLRQASAAGDRNGTSYGLGYMYALSKRTSLYGTYGYVKNSANGTFALLAGDPIVAPGAPGASPQGLGFGIRHSF